jgi:hypothetical protein
LLDCRNQLDIRSGPATHLAAADVQGWEPG